MKFNYFRKTGEYYREVDGEREWDGDNGYNFDYEVPKDEIPEALEDIIIDLYFDGLSDNASFYSLVRQGLRKMLKNIETDDLCEQFKDELKDYFEEEALEAESAD